MFRKIGIRYVQHFVTNRWQEKLLIFFDPLWNVVQNFNVAITHPFVLKVRKVTKQRRVGSEQEQIERGRCCRPRQMLIDTHL